MTKKQNSRMSNGGQNGRDRPLGSDIDVEQYRLNRRTTWLTAASFLVAIASALFTGLQLWENHSGDGRAQKQADAAAAAAAAAQSEASDAHKLADNSVQQVRSATEIVTLLAKQIDVQRNTALSASIQALAARQSAEQLRPRIAISFPKPAQFGAGLRTPVYVIYKNYSNLPAENFHTDSFVAIWPFPVDRQAMRRELTDHKFMGGPISKLEPGASIHDKPTISAPGNDRVAAVEDGTHFRLVAAGVAVYRDSRGVIHHSYGCTTWGGKDLSQNLDCDAGPDD
ncbi:MAG TPA: hypothetical protein VGF77_06045 [Allosphingosinicella sp.]|jgi:hypothetical protein